MLGFEVVHIEIEKDVGACGKKLIPDAWDSWKLKRNHDARTIFKEIIKHNKINKASTYIPQLFACPDCVEKIDLIELKRVEL